jgi:hypothetical protein
MPRPLKTNAEYFPHDSDMRNDPKIKALRRKFSHTGFSVWNMLLETITDADNFEIEWNNLNIELISGDFDIDPALLTEIIDYCLSINLITNNNGFIQSKSLINRFSSLLSKRKRQRNIVIADYNTKSKVKESKVNKSKEIYNISCTCPDLNLLNEIMEYFGFTEIRNPDKQTQIYSFLSVLDFDGKLEYFREQFIAYRQYKESSKEIIHTFPKFIGTIEGRYLDGGWNSRNWTKSNNTAKKESSLNSVEIFG